MRASELCVHLTFVCVNESRVCILPVDGSCTLGLRWPHTHLLACTTSTELKSQIVLLQVIKETDEGQIGAHKENVEKDPVVSLGYQGHVHLLMRTR